MAAVWVIRDAGNRYQVSPYLLEGGRRTEPVPAPAAHTLRYLLGSGSGDSDGDGTDSGSVHICVGKLFRVNR